MLLCKACNTRFEDGKSACPSCGRRVFASVSESAPAEGKKVPLSPSSASDGDASDTAVDFELGEVDVLAEAVEEEAEAKPERVEAEAKPDKPAAAVAKPHKPAAAVAKPDQPERAEPVAARAYKPERPARAERPAAPRTRRTLEVEPGPAVLHLSAAQVRTLVAEQPELLEPALEIYRDQKKGAVGVDYRTPVGAIDLLAVDAGGDFVVVMVPDPRDADMLMPEVLARVGYVRKHLADDRAVRGIVVIEEIPEELAYAAVGLAQTIAFKAFRVALTFHDLAV